jgi:capsular exopolysaccharide synthesis family protein
MNDFMEVRKIIEIIRRQLWLLILVTVAAGVIGYGFSQLETRVYAATATIQVGRAINSTSLDRVDLQFGEELALTYAELIRRKPVLQGTVDALQLEDSWRGLRERVQISPVENTQLLEIRVTAGSPQEAQVIADEVARQVILNGPMTPQDAEADSARAFAQQRLNQLQTNIEAAQQKIEQLGAEMATIIVSSPDRASGMQADIDALELLIADWDGTYAQLLTFLSVEPPVNQLSIVETAEINPTPIRPRVRLNIMVAVLIGFLLALGLVLLRGFLDDTLQPTDAVSEILGLATLANISRVKGKSGREKLLFRQDLFSPASEDYRLLRNKVQVMCADWPRKVIMITSPMPGELKSITVANLGIVLAKAGFQVIIVDANLRQPMQHILFELPNRVGLTELLCAPAADLDGHLKFTNVQNLQVLPVGALPPPHPAELLGSAQMSALLDRLATRVDIVLCDSAQTVAIADGLVLSRQVDAVILVIEMGKTRRSLAEQAVLDLQQAGANLLGTVLNPMPVHKAAAPPLVTPAPSSVNGRHTEESVQTTGSRSNHRVRTDLSKQAGEVTR